MLVLFFTKSVDFILLFHIRFANDLFADFLTGYLLLPSSN
ncbi:hypothetical protein D2M30_3872 [Bacillus amyloliquefaciens]|nr:hypothetical protein D2M30_3872 [Bacillus amyloliquefaciens]